MQSERLDGAIKAAFTMLEAFHRTGANRFDLTITNAQGEKIRFRQSVFIDDLRRSLPQLFDESLQHGRNIIIRPRGPAVQYVQLDDLEADRLDKVLAVSFLAIETSPGNYQAWIAIPESSTGEDFARRLRKGSGADPTASGATRIAGSFNFKAKYHPDYPQVQITQILPGHIVTKDQLEILGLVAAPEKAPSKPLPQPSRRPGPDKRKWPSYARCLQGAPPNHAGSGPDVSRADFSWCMTAIDWGWSIADTAAQLVEVSPKAQEAGERYALLTAQNAAAVVERRKHNTR